MGRSFQYARGAFPLDGPHIGDGLPIVAFLQLYADVLAPEFDRLVSLGPDPGERRKDRIARIRPQLKRPMDHL